MEIYIAMIQDRHTDVEVHSFSDPDKAIDYARSRALESCKHDEYYEEQEVESWLFCASYSCEGDFVRVVKTELDDELIQEENQPKEK